MNTPQKLLRQLDAEFDFNMVLSEPSDNALDFPWENKCFVHPPKTNRTAWLQKAYIESQKGATIVCLIPAKTDTGYWENFCLKAHEIRFLTHRLQFENYNHVSTVPSILVVFRPIRMAQPILSTYTVNEED